MIGPLQRLRRLRARATSLTGNLSILLLAAAGTGVVLFTLVASSFLYSNTRGLVVAQDWVDHTHEVLSWLQAAQRLTDRVDSSMRLYTVTGDPSQLEAARTAADDLEAAASRIQGLVSDNRRETQNAENSIACSANLKSDAGRPPAPGGVSADWLECHGTLGLMVEQERSLLEQRSRTSQHSLYVSLTTECATIGLLVAVLVVLFGFLLRDAVLRRGIARQAMRTNEELKASVQALEQNIGESTLLTACRDELQLCVQVEQAYRSAAVYLGRLLPQSSGWLSMINHSRNLVEAVATWGESGHGEAGPEGFLPEACCGLRLGHPRWRRRGLSEIDCTHFAGPAPSHYLCLPLVAQGEMLGVLTIECEEEAAFATVELRMEGLRQILQLTGMTVASLNLHAKLEHQSIRDSLTGLFNRHFMQVVLGRELSRAVRQQSSLAVFMLDVDHFKQFNDTFGHGAGDAMLKSVAQVFQASVRDEDTVCRYGGEEFTMIVPGMTPEDAYARAELVRRAVADLRVSLDCGIPGKTTVSIGIALYPTDGTDADALLRLADQALYRAKRQGRNQVSLCEALLGV